MRVLEKIAIENFKSIRSQELELGRLNVFIGANGAGKSNLIQAFRSLREIAAQNLARYSLVRGADSLLYCGRKTSQRMSLYFQFSEDNTSNGYRISLLPTEEDSLAVERETVTFHDRVKHLDPYVLTVSEATREAVLAKNKNPIAHFVRRDLDTFRLYHFHDTSDSAPVKSLWAVDDSLLSL